MEFKLIRNSTGPDGTFGTLTWNDNSLVTLELPWNNGDNHPDKSCILPGTYEMIVDESPHLEEATPRLLDVDGRSQIRIHEGNFEANTLGCILVGQATAQFGNAEGITDSKPSLALVMRVMNADLKTSTITVINDFSDAPAEAA